MTFNSIELKGSLQAMTYLIIKKTDLDTIKTELHNLTQKAPGMFQNTPVVADFHNIDGSVDASFFEALKAHLWSLQIYLVGIRNATIQSSQAAHQLGIPTLLTKHESKPERTQTHKQEPALILNHNIRSGQQITTEHQDIVVMGNLSPTAEIKSTNSAHINGVLAGKVIAGIKNPNAIITCHCFQAELISINGIYQLTEHFPKHIIGQPVCISLKHDTLQFTLRKQSQVIMS